MGGYVGPRASLDPMAKRKVPAPVGNRTSSRAARSLVTVLIELPLILSTDCSGLIRAVIFALSEELLSNVEGYKLFNHEQEVEGRIYGAYIT
jgi:hypothetical protein